MVFVICLVIVIFGLLAYWINMHGHKRSEFYEKIKKFPCTNQAFPLLGDVYLMSFNKSINEKIKFFISENQKYLTTLKVWFGPKLVIMINNVEDIKTVLTSPHCTNKSSVYHLAIGGDGLFVANGDKWKNQRRHLNTTFNPRLLNSYSPEFNQFGRNIVTALKSHAIDGKQFDITSLLGAHITDLLTRTLYGSRDHSFEVSKNFYELVERLMSLWGERTLKLYGYFIMILIKKLCRVASEEKKLNKMLRSGLQPIIDQKEQEYLKRAQEIDENNNPSFPLKEENFLEKLTRLRVEGIIAPSEFRHTVMTMFLAGSETSARTLASILVTLAIHQDYQEKVYEEISDFYDAYNGGDIDITKLGELSLLDRVIKESLRLFPVVPFIGRTPSRDIEITEGTIPAGTDCIVSLVNIHLNPNVWGENAHEFNPDNFLPENVAQRERCGFIPFSYGPRNCIGYKFAQLSVYIGVAYLLKNYKLKTTLKAEELEMGYGLTTFILNGYMVSVHPRNPVTNIS